MYSSLSDTAVIVDVAYNEPLLRLNFILIVLNCQGCQA